MQYTVAVRMGTIFFEVRGLMRVYIRLLLLSTTTHVEKKMEYILLALQHTIMYQGKRVTPPPSASKVQLAEKR